MAQEHINTLHYSEYKLQALVNSILPSTIAIIGYTSWHLSHSFPLVFKRQWVSNHTVNPDTADLISFVTAHIAYASTHTKKNPVIWFQIYLFLIFTQGGHTQCLYACFDAMFLPVLTLKHFTNFTEVTDSVRLTGVILVDGCTEIRSAPSMA